VTFRLTSDLKIGTVRGLHGEQLDPKQRAAIQRGILLALPPPILVLALGWALGWALRGFGDEPKEKV
jgi:hypothetical protein